MASLKIIFGLLTFVTVGMIIGALFQLSFIRKLEESSGTGFPSFRRTRGSQKDNYLQFPGGVSHWTDDKEAEALRIGFVKPEIISWSPRIIVLHNFLSMEECDFLRAIAKPRLRISTVVDTKTGKVCTDNASNYKLAGKWLMEKEGSKLYWMPCAAHCLNLMLGDVGKLPLVKEIVHEAQQISIFIYNHKHVLHLMRKETKGREILRPSVTRFATTFLCLQSMYDKHQHLRDMVRRDDWRRSKWPKNKMAIEIVKKIKSSTFWNTMHTCLKIMAPIVDVLRMVDTEEKPSMAYVYSAMEICKAKIKANIGEATLEDRNLWKKMERIVDKRWSDLLQKPLHCAAHYLNPQVYYASVQSSMEIESNQVIKEGLLQCIEKLAEDEEKETQILSELSTYRSRGARLGKKNAISCLKTMAPVEWWIIFGSEVPALQRFATRVLGLTCSASPCEGNWSTFSNGIKSDVRTSSGMFLNPEERKFPMVQAIEKRIAVYSQVPAENGELIQVLRYEKDQFYKPHHDYFSDTFNLKRGGQRVATILMYLTDNVEGGETYFPMAGTEECLCGGKTMKGMSVKPIKGDAVLFWSMGLDGKSDPKSIHGGCEVLAGEKWSATKWMRQRTTF